MNTLVGTPSSLSKRVLVCLALLCLWAFVSVSAWGIAGKAGPEIGTAPPPLVLSQVLAGPALPEIQWEKLKGKVVVVEFWSTTCAPCVAAVPHLNQLAREFRHKPVVFLAVSDENPDRVRDFLKRKPVETWIALDGPFAPTQTAFDVKGIPHTVIVDAAGKVAAVTHPNSLEARHLEEILAGQPSSLPRAKSWSEEPEVVAVNELAREQYTQVEVSIRGPFPQPEGA